MRRIGVVGAGAAAAATAFALRETDAEVTVLEAAPSVGGRAGSRRHEGCVYDHGTNYLKADDERVVELVTETLSTEGLVEVDGPVWTFDGGGSVSEGDGGTDRKWSYRDGLGELTRRLFDGSDATVETGVRVTGLVHDGGDGGDDGEEAGGRGRWRLVDETGTEWGPFDGCVLSPPAPETAALLADAEWDAPARESLVEACREVTYRPVLTAVLGYPFELQRPFYALVNADGAHELGWVAREGCKPGHVPDGQSVLVVQTSREAVGDTDPPETATNQGTDAAAETGRVAELVAALLDEARLADPAWTDHRWWDPALPDGGVEGRVRSAAADAGLHVVGDWVVGEARLHAAVRSGLELGERLG